MTSALPVPAESIQTGITNNWTRVRPSFFRGLARVLEYAEDKCFGLILDSTIGYGRTWEKISFSGKRGFCTVAGVTRRGCEQAITELLSDGLIRSRPATSGNGKEYAITARADGDVTGIAKCRGCGTVGEVDLDLDFIPVPHSFFVSLPAACDHGMYLVVKTIVERTMRWDKITKQIVVNPCEISIEEFERATGKKRAELWQDIAKVQALGCQFIGSEKAGRTNRYWARPENFTKGAPRSARKVKQPLVKRKKGETEKPENIPQPVEPKQPVRPAEFVTLPCGVCRHCQTYGPMDIVPESEKKPVEQARAGPKPKTAYQKAQDDAWERIAGVKHA